MHEMGHAWPAAAAAVQQARPVDPSARLGHLEQLQRILSHAPLAGQSQAQRVPLIKLQRLGHCGSDSRWAGVSSERRSGAGTTCGDGAPPPSAGFSAPPAVPALLFKLHATSSAACRPCSVCRRGAALLPGRLLLAMLLLLPALPPSRAAQATAGAARC